MFLQDRIDTRTRVTRKDNPRHQGRVAAVSGLATGMPGLVAQATYRVVWDNGWREDFDRERFTDELTRY